MLLGMIYLNYYNISYDIAKELIVKVGTNKGSVLVVGCSTSEIMGDKIGSNSNYDVGSDVFAGIYKAACEAGIYIAAQCCEHLNRALIVEREIALRDRLEIVNAVPMPKAGGSFATACYKNLKDPVCVEKIKCDLGIDIGGTLIGMHLKDVAVPIRLTVSKIGEASIICARTRPKFIGGSRTSYDDKIK